MGDTRLSNPRRLGGTRWAFGAVPVASVSATEPPGTRAESAPHVGLADTLAIHDRLTDPCRRLAGTDLVSRRRPVLLCAVVPEPRFELGRPRGLRSLSPLRLPFRHSGRTASVADRLSLQVGVEATTGFEPVNRGFADLRVEPLHHVATGWVSFDPG